jgi:hypothetical protein
MKNNDKKIKDLEKLLSNPHISEDMKKNAREAIEKLKIEKKSADNLPKTGSFQHYLGDVYDEVGQLADVTHSDAQGMVDIYEDLVERKYEMGESAEDAAEYILSLNQSEEKLNQIKSKKTKKPIKKNNFNNFLNDVYSEIQDIAKLSEREAKELVKNHKDAVKKEYEKGTNAIKVAYGVSNGTIENESKSDILEKAKAKKATRKSKGKGVGALIKGGKSKQPNQDENCDEILKKFKERKKQCKKSSKKAAIKTEKKEKAHEKYPELDNLIQGLADEVSNKINTITKKVESKMPYKAQYVLEELIKELQSRV